MHLLRFNPEDKTLREVPPGEFAADPACRYFYVQGKRAAVPIATPDGIGEIVWQHPDYQPPSPANAMTDQQPQRFTSDNWQWVQDVAHPRMVACFLELRDRITALETHIAAIEPLDARTQAATVSALHLALVTSKLGHRVEALESAQHAHIEAKAAETGARCAVEQLRSKPAVRRLMTKTETTYGESCDPVVDQVLALQNRIQNGSLTLADALEEINNEPDPAQPFTAKYLFTADNIQEDSFRFDFNNTVLFDLATVRAGLGCLAPGDNIKIAHRFGEAPAIGVSSTINYRVLSVSETEDRAWTIRAVRVDNIPGPAAVPRQLALVERVADALNPSPDENPIFLYKDEARAAIRVVAAAALQMHPDPNLTWERVALWLEREASR